MKNDHSTQNKDPRTNISNKPDERQTKRTYANAVTNPTNDQAIVIQAKEGLLVNDYLDALISLVSPTEIRFASKISNQRVCIFLSSKDTVSEVTKKHQKINVKGNLLEMRPLIKGLKKIILSNVSPIIPNEVIENSLKIINIEPKSTISYMRAGTQNPALTHVLSFRRQLLINPEDIDKIPDSILITHEETTYRIFFASESATCFICKQMGHIAKQCQESTETIHKTNDTYINDNLPNPNLLGTQSASKQTPSNSNIIYQTIRHFKRI